MVQALMKTTALTPMSDGFDHVDEESPTGGAAFVKFDGVTMTLWFYRDGAALRQGPWIVVSCHREAVMFRDKRVADRIFQQPGEPVPDVDALNAAIPQKDWEENPFGEPKGPWQLQYVICLVNPEDGSRIVSSNSTFGQKAAFDDLKGRVKFMRGFRGAQVMPVVELSSRQMDEIWLKAAPAFRNHRVA